jgi:hypothetical protein
VYFDGDGLRVACQPPETVVPGEPFDLVVLVAGSAHTPTLKVTLTVDGREASGVDIRPADETADPDEQMPAHDTYAFVAHVPALAAGSVAALAFTVRDGEREVPLSGDEGAAMMTITPGLGPLSTANEREVAVVAPPRTLVDLVEPLGQGPFDGRSVDALLGRLSQDGVTTPEDLLHWRRCRSRPTRSRGSWMPGSARRPTLRPALPRLSRRC